MKDAGERDNRVKKLEELVKALESKSCEMEDGFFKQNADLDAFKLNVQMNMRGVSGLVERVADLEDHDEDHEKRLAELESDMKDAKNKLLLAGSGGGDVDGNALAQLLDNLREEFDNKYATKDSMKDL